MGHYKSNVRDLEFNLFDVLGLDTLLDAGTWGETDADTVRTMLREAAALAVITTLRQAPGSAATAMAALQTEVAQLRAQINGDKAVSTVDDAIKAGKLIPAQRDWALGLARTDMAALSAYLATAPVIPMNGQSGNKEREGETTATEAALSAQLIKGFGLTPEQFAKAKPAAA